MLHHAAKLALAPILYAQARRVRAAAVQLPEPQGERTGIEGDGAQRLRLLVTGDSSAAGVGADTQDEALARPLARLLARRLGGSVAWQLVAQTGLTSEGVFALLRAEDVAPADVAVIIVGVNDLTTEVRLGRALAWRGRIAQWLHQHAATRHIVFTSMPEIQRFPLIPQPLAWYADLWAQRNNAAQARWLRTLQGGMHVDLGGLTRAEWMARDGYHPAPPLYAQVAGKLSDAIGALVERD
jgi:lysophospholipase L1-like esterase